jgi:hypothetical protein
MALSIAWTQLMHIITGFEPDKCDSSRFEPFQAAPPYPAVRKPASPCRMARRAVLAAPRWHRDDPMTWVRRLSRWMPVTAASQDLVKFDTQALWQNGYPDFDVCKHTVIRIPFISQSPRTRPSNAQPAPMHPRRFVQRPALPLVALHRHGFVYHHLWGLLQTVLCTRLDRDAQPVSRSIVRALARSPATAARGLPASPTAAGTSPTARLAGHLRRCRYSGRCADKTTLYAALQAASSGSASDSWYSVQSPSENDMNFFYKMQFFLG